MLTFVDAAGPYRLPTGWPEVSTAQYLALDARAAATVEARAGFFAGRPVQVNGVVADALAWLLDPPPLSGLLPYPADLGQQSFLQVEEIRAALATTPLPECYGLVFGVFSVRALRPHVEAYQQPWAHTFAVNCLAWPITDTFPAVAHCLAELRRLGETFAELAAPDPTDAARRARAAGAATLDGFGHLNVARHYAELFGTTLDAIYQRPWQEIALFMLQDRRRAIVADTLEKQSTVPAPHHE